MFSHTHMHTNTHKHTTRMMYILHLWSLSPQHNTACLEIYNQLLWFVTLHTQSLLGFLFPPPPPLFFFLSYPRIGKNRPPPPPSCATYSPHTYLMTHGLSMPEHEKEQDSAALGAACNANFYSRYKNLKMKCSPFSCLGCVTKLIMTVWRIKVKTVPLRSK